MLVSFNLGILSRHLHVAIVFDFTTNSFDHGAFLFERLLYALSKVVIVDLSSDFVVKVLELLHFGLDI